MGDGAVSEAGKGVILIGKLILQYVGRYMFCATAKQTNSDADREPNIHELDVLSAFEKKNHPATVTSTVPPCIGVWRVQQLVLVCTR